MSNILLPERGIWKPPLGAQVDVNWKHWLTQDLLNFWLLNQAAGELTIPDLVGRENMAIPGRPGLSFGAGAGGYGVSNPTPTNGTNYKATLSTYKFGSDGNNWTIDFYLNWTIGSSTATLFNIPSAGYPSIIFNTTYRVFISNNGTTIWSPQVNTQFSTNVPTHVCLVHEADNTHSCYINGKYWASSANNAIAWTNNGVTAYVFNNSAVNNGFPGQIMWMRVWGRRFTASEALDLFEDPLGMLDFDPIQRFWSAANNYTLPAAAGSYSETGQGAGLRADRKMAGGPGAFTESGKASNLLLGRRLFASPNSFIETGQDAGLLAARKLSSGPGAFAETGVDSGLRATRTLSALTGAYAENGISAGLIYSHPGVYELYAVPGEFLVSGKDAGLPATRKMGAGAGVFALSGQISPLLAARRLAAESALYLLAGSSANLIPPARTLIEVRMSAYGDGVKKSGGLLAEEDMGGGIE